MKYILLLALHIGIGSWAAPAPPAHICAYQADSSVDTVTLAPQTVKLSLALRALSGSTNAVYSPLSLYLAMAQMMPGASGQTLAELKQALLPGGMTTEIGLKTIGKLMGKFECPSSYQSTNLWMANRIFLQKNKTLKPTFLSELGKWFNTSVGEVDFSTHTQQAAKEINDWVLDQTRNMIPELVSPSLLRSDTKLVLVNALYGKGNWEHPFFPKATGAAPFYRLNRDNASVPTMRLDGRRFYVASNPTLDFNAVHLPLIDNALTMVIVLPNKRDGLPKLMSKWDTESVASLFAPTRSRPVQLHLPRFKVESSLDPLKAFRKVGIQRALRADAEFDGIDGGVDKLYISAAIHRALLTVDEKGFEGAAATALSMAAGSAPPKPEPPLTFKADHPFAFFVIDPQSKAIVFAGTVWDPK